MGEAFYLEAEVLPMKNEALLGGPCGLCGHVACSGLCKTRAYTEPTRFSSGWVGQDGPPMELSVGVAALVGLGSQVKLLILNNLSLQLPHSGSPHGTDPNDQR